MNKRLLRVSEVSEVLGISERGVYRLLAAGAIPALKVSGALRVDRDDLGVFIEMEKEVFAFENGLSDYDKPSSPKISIGLT